MPYRVRFTTPADVPQCAALSRDAVVLSSYDNSRRIQRWCKWLREGYANSAVVVDEADNVMAFGLSVYISDGLLGQTRQGDGHTENYLQRISDRVLAPSEAIKAHQGEGLNLLGFYGWRTDLPPEDAKQVGWLLLQSFLYLHRGLHLKSFTKEVYGEEELSHYVEMGCTVFRTPEQFPEHTRRREPYIVGADRQEMLETGRFYKHLFGMFRHGAPALKLERNRLELVQMAYLLGLSDEEILMVPEMQPKPKKTACRRAQQGNQGDNAMALVRQRWSRLYDKMDKAGIQWHHSGRNSQRHDFLQYVEKHREVAFPVLIGRYFYRHPDLAKRFPIPLEA